MKILVTGVSGQLGYDVADALHSRGFDVLSPTHKIMDITEFHSVDNYFSSNKPDALIHCAAWTAVDLAEDQIEECRKVNVKGTENLVNVCRLHDIPIMYISTDYVFDGSGSTPRSVSDPIAPINQYGLSKAEGEKIVSSYDKYFIIRISWVFGINGKNFIKTMLNLSKKMDTVKVVSDQFGSPTYTYDLAPLLCDMIVSNKYGIYHAHNEGICTWYDVAVATFKYADIKMKVIPITSDEYPTKAKRPANSRLDTSSITDAGFKALPDWKDAVNRYVKSLTQQVNPEFTLE